MSPRRLLAGLLAAAFAACATAPAQAQITHDGQVRNGFPHRDGPFSAMMIFIPHSELAEFDKPADQAPNVSMLRTARAGDVVAIKIVFDNPEPRDKAFIDITYDLKITGPDGAIYSDTDHKGLEAVRGEVWSPTAGVYDNRVAVVAVGFEPQDRLGVYTATAVLHDNNANRHVPLTAEIELTK